MLPPELAAAIESELAARPQAALAQSVAALSRRYRETVGRTPSAEVDVSAYLAARLPATYAATAAAMRATAQLRPGFAPRSLLDAGSGPGTAAWAAVTTWPSLDRFTLLDRDVPMQTAGRRLAGAARQEGLRDARWEQRDLMQTSPLPSGELVTAAYVLGELEPVQRIALARRLWEACDGILLIVEPGTPAGYMAVQDARVALLALGARTVAPCPHDLLCPLMKTGAEHWCHFRERLERSRTHRLAKQAERGYEDEPYAYVALSREAPRPIAARVVGAPRIGHGHVELELCTPECVHTDVVGRRRGEEYRLARRLHWGDALLPQPAGDLRSDRNVDEDGPADSRTTWAD